MSKFGKFEIGHQFSFNGETVTITGKEKGNKTAKPNKQSGLTTGYCSNPCLYILSNGYKVRGSTIVKNKQP